MKKTDWKRLVIAVGGMALLSTTPAFAGTWERSENDWQYLQDDGTYAEYEWIQGQDGAWYYCKRWGIMERNYLVDNKYYVDADGKWIQPEDSQNPFCGVMLYGTAFLTVNSYQDCGEYYLADVNLHDSSFASNSELSKYNKGDKFWIESQGGYGKVTDVSVSTSGEMAVTVRRGSDEYIYTARDAFCSSPEGETLVTRLVKEHISVKIPKQVPVDYSDVTSSMHLNQGLSLKEFLDSGYGMMTPVFEGDTVTKFYDSVYNYMG